MIDIGVLMEIFDEEMSASGRVRSTNVCLWRSLKRKCLLEGFGREGKRHQAKNKWIKITI